ncbi:hypothetical protein LOZ53_004317 [Ophidiomyces ophidiicola]|nr:hypothetical protein LOZ55_002653 [Ophidiomyces ophidiicola]KAI1987540.1 hypothetical protein LOZ53_004317 [Ophidiomyces ophidiicola]KAI2003190.1 hypothetical protein LOZ51_000264 [Ophidiomyces ophidiicola]
MASNFRIANMRLCRAFGRNARTTSRSTITTTATYTESVAAPVPGKRDLAVVNNTPLAPGTDNGGLFALPICSRPTPKVEEANTTAPFLACYDFEMLFRPPWFVELPVSTTRAAAESRSKPSPGTTGL